MSKISKTLRTILQELTWYLACVKAKFSKPEQTGDVLLIPAADLSGGFGEDIMIMSFLENFASDRNVTIYTKNKIERPDFIRSKHRVRYAGDFLGESDYLDALNIIRKHSLVYVIGADIMDGTYGKRLSLSRLRVLHLGSKLGLDVQISGFSVSKNIKPDVRKKLLENTSFMTIKSRDVESYKRLASFIPEQRLLLTNDIAFICADHPEIYNSPVFDDYSGWVSAMRQKGKKIAAICPNSIQAKKTGLESYIADFGTLLEKLESLGEYAFAFLYHDLRPLCGKENDSTMSRMLFENFSAKGTDCYYTDRIKSGVELKGYLSKSDFTVTGRMHFGISGITYGKPMFGVAYANKFEGMLRLFDISPEWCLVDYDKMKDADSKIRAFLKYFEDMETRISQHLPAVQADTRKNYVCQESEQLAKVA